MKINIMYIFVLLFLTSCATTSPEAEYKNSLRTDGVYETINELKNGEKGYIQFFISEQGTKQFKMLTTSKFSSEEFNKKAQVITYFSVNPERQEIRYEMDDGKVRASASTNLNKFIFKPNH